MTTPLDQLDWPAADSDEFVGMLCLFAEHLSADEIRAGLLVQIRVHGRPMLEHLERLILSERVKDADVRATVVAALGWSGQSSSTTAVRAALGDSSPQVLRAAARAAWFDLRQPQLVPRLLDMLSQPDAEPDVAAAAAESLSYFRFAQALPAMVRLVLSPPGRLTDEERGQLLAAVERLASVRFGESEEAPLRERLARLRMWWQDRQAAGEDIHG